MPPSPPLLPELLELFEQSGHPQVTREGRGVPGVPGWALPDCFSGDEQALRQWFDEVGEAGTIQVSSDDGPVVAVLEDDDSGDCTYRCPVTFKRRRLPRQQGALYSVREQPFLTCLADLLSIPQAHRKGITSPAIDRILWQLGRARIGTYHTDVWITRNLHENIDDICRYLDDPRQPDQGVILTTSAELPARFATPRRYCVIPISEVIIIDGESIAIDTDLLHRRMTSPAGTDHRPRLPVDYDEFNGILKIRGKEDWVIEGDIQRGAVHYLFDAYCNGRTAVKAAEILKAVGCGGEQFGKSQRMQDVFSGNPRWRDYLHTVERGMYAFKLD